MLLAVFEALRGAVEHILGGLLDLLLHLGWDLGFVEALALLLEPLAALLAPLDEVIRGGDDGVRIALGKLDRLFRGLRVDEGGAVLLELFPQCCAEGGLALLTLVELLELSDQGFVASAMIRVVLADDGAACLDILRVLAEALVAAGAAGLVSHGSLFSVVVCPGRVLALLDLLGRCAQCLSDYRNSGTRCPA